MNPSDYAALKVIEDQMLQSAINNSSLADAGFNRSDLGLSFACNICYVSVMIDHYNCTGSDKFIRPNLTATKCTGAGELDSSLPLGS